MLDLDAHLGLHAEALQLRARRTELIANNLANADTPGFKARDVDFRTVLASAGGGGAAVPLRTTQARHIDAGAVGTADGASLPTKYRVPLAPSLDGNTVDPQLEQASFAENAMRYQATLSFINSKFRGLMTAITGQ